MENTTIDESQRQQYELIAQLKNEGNTDEQISERLMSDGLDKEGADTAIANWNNYLASQQAEYGDGPPESYLEGTEEEEGSGFPKWAIYILIIVGINVLSYLFDWPFWIY